MSYWFDWQTVVVQIPSHALSFTKFMSKITSENVREKHREEICLRSNSTLCVRWPICTGSARELRPKLPHLIRRPVSWSETYIGWDDDESKKDNKRSVLNPWSSTKETMCYIIGTPFTLAKSCYISTSTYVGKIVWSTTTLHYSLPKAVPMFKE